MQADKSLGIHIEIRSMKMYQKISHFFREYNLISKALNVIALLVTQWWLITSITFEPNFRFEWEPLVTFLATLASLTWLEFNDTKKTAEEKRVDADTALFKKFLIDLPSESPAIKFFRTEFTGKFYSIDLISLLEDFTYNWDTTERDFHDEQIQQSKERLIGLLHELLEFGSIKMSPINGQVMGIHYQVDSLEYKQTEEHLIYLASEIIAAHQELIRRAKARLIV